MGGLGEWLTTKKTGRDDAQIAKDKALALQARKRKHPTANNNKKKTTKKRPVAAKKPAPKKKKKKTAFLVDDNDDESHVVLSESSNDESMDSFIVDDDSDNKNDDDDEEEDSLSEPEFDEEEEEEEDDKDGASSSDDDDDSDTPKEGFLSALSSRYANATSKPAPHRQARPRPPPPQPTRQRKPPPQRRNPFAAFAADSRSNNNSSKENCPPPRGAAPGSHNNNNHNSMDKKKTTNSTKRQLPPVVNYLDSSSQDENDDENDAESPFPPQRRRKQSSQNVAKKRRQVLEEEDDDDDGEKEEDKPPKDTHGETKGPPTSSSKTKMTAFDALVDLMDSSSSSSDEDPTDLHPTKTTKKKNHLGSARPVPTVQPAAAAAPNGSGDSLSKLTQLMQDDSDDDEDEQMAMALALSNSLTHTNKNNNNNSSHGKKATHRPAKDSNRTSVLGQLDQYKNDEHEEHDLEEEEEDDQDDGFVVHDSKEARQAASVLAKANELSAQVLQTMQTWTVPDASSNSSSSNTMGLIVDGALALTHIHGDDDDDGTDGKGPNDGTKPATDEDGAADSNRRAATASSSLQPRKWISNELMRRICPNVTLAHYQLIGVNWMALLHGLQIDMGGGTNKKKKKKNPKTNVNGILADEMGLGKTAQTITFLAWLKHERETQQQLKQQDKQASTTKQTQAVVDLVQDDSSTSSNSVQEVVPNSMAPGTIKPCSHQKYHSPHLVVAPASVLSNWEREFHKFAPHLNVVKYHGTQNQRQALQDQLRPHLRSNWMVCSRKERPELVDVILTPITYFQKEKSPDRAFLRKFQYHYLVVDEAHLLKNSQGLRYTTLNKMKTQNRLLLTGTPVQNSPQELMSLLCFLMPLFSTHPLNRSKANDSDDDDDDEGHNKNSRDDGGQSMLQHFVSLEKKGVQVDNATAYQKLKQLFAPFVLRRRKQQVLHQLMPPKERKVEFVELDETARNVYNRIISDHVQAKKSGTRQMDHVFTQLRKAAHHPLLLRTRHTRKEERHELATLFHEYGAFRGDGCNNMFGKVLEAVNDMNDFDIHLMALELMDDSSKLRRETLSKYVLEEADLWSSAKCVRLRQLVPELVEQGHRVLIFSVWTSCLDLLSCLMEHLGMSYLRMEGSTPVQERQGLIDKFAEDTSIPVFLLSTKACGLGINLTAADTCIMHDIDFNPFNDLQAEDRVHRIGQTKKTTVIKLVAADTVDADIYEMQQRKARMNAAIMDSSGDNSWNKQEAKAAKDQVMRTAVDRFLSQSPMLSSRLPSQQKSGQLATLTKQHSFQAEGRGSNDSGEEMETSPDMGVKPKSSPDKGPAEKKCTGSSDLSSGMLATKPSGVSSSLIEIMEDSDF